jgi:hypothetical protein
MTKVQTNTQLPDDVLPCKIPAFKQCIFEGCKEYCKETGYLNPPSEGDVGVVVDVLLMVCGKIN